MAVVHSQKEDLADADSKSLANSDTFIETPADTFYETRTACRNARLDEDYFTALLELGEMSRLEQLQNTPKKDADNFKEELCNITPTETLFLNGTAAEDSQEISITRLQEETIAFKLSVMEEGLCGMRQDLAESRKLNAAYEKRIRPMVYWLLLLTLLLLVFLVQFLVERLWPEPEPEPEMSFSSLLAVAWPFRLDSHYI